MAVAQKDTTRCTEDEWRELRDLAKHGMLFEMQDWIRDGKPTLRPHRERSSIFRIAVERRNHSMVRVLWENGWQDADEAAYVLRLADDKIILRYLLEAGCPVTKLSGSELCTSNDLDLIRLGIRRGVSVTGGDGWGDAFRMTGGKPLLRFFREEKSNIAGLVAEGVHALRDAIEESDARQAALLVWVGVDPFAPCPYNKDEWHSPESEWNYFPAASIVHAGDIPEMLKALKLKPNPEQWLQLLNWSAGRLEALEAVILLRGDASDIIRTYPDEASKILQIPLEPVRQKPIGVRERLERR